MKYFAVISKMLNVEKNNMYREEHLDYLKQLGKEGKVFAKGRFVDGAGGLVIYKADSEKEVEYMVKGDPFIIQGARSYEIHEWAIHLVDNIIS
ncbi:YciI family protein [Bacillus sp. OTU530]|uniref:YciI family protein n=1 Tax=Bacillus sp. OTU530 TaxID=3043862 RepID=UPI00313BC4CE